MLRTIVASVAATAVAVGGSAYAAYQNQAKALAVAQAQNVTLTSELERVDHAAGNVIAACDALRLALPKPAAPAPASAER